MHIEGIDCLIHQSRSGVVLDDLLDLSFIRRSILLKQIVRIGLSWRVWVWVIEQVLNANQDRSDGDCWLPAFFLIENGQTDGT
jgi:hypothetical protein